MAKLQLGRFPISKNVYVVSQIRITTLWCSIGATLSSFRAFCCTSPCQRQCRLCRMQRWVVLKNVSS